jgi:hypothetical protein
LLACQKKEVIKVNLKLKSAIVLNFGTQGDFARAVGEHEEIVSRVIRGRRELDPEKKAKWARVLGLKLKDFEQPLQQH